MRTIIWWIVELGWGMRSGMKRIGEFFCARCGDHHATHVDTLRDGRAWGAPYYVCFCGKFSTPDFGERLVKAHDESGRARWV